MIIMNSIFCLVAIVLITLYLKQKDMPIVGGLSLVVWGMVLGTNIFPLVRGMLQ